MNEATPAVLQVEKTVAERLIAEMMKRRNEALERKKRSDPQHNPRASNIHDCARNIVYQVLDWDKKKPWDNWMLARFEEGNRQEKAVIDEIRADGFEVIDRDENGQLTMAIPDKNTPEFRMGEVCTGRLDCMIKWEGVWLPCEVKSMDPNAFRGIRNLQDFMSANATYKKWPRQLLMYLYGRRKDQGIFVISDCLGHRLYIPVYLDEAEALFILAHLEGAARNIRERTYPERIPYDDRLCGKCQFATTCLPDMIAKEAELVDNEVLEAEIAEHEALKPAASKYDKIHDKLRDTFKGIEKLIVGGRFLVQMLPSKRTAYDLPPEKEEEINAIKREFAKKVPVARLSIMDLDKKEAGTEQEA